MKYRLRLKDRELHKKLDEISNGDFSAQLEREKDIISKRCFNHSSHVIWFGKPFISLTIQVGMLERVEEYDPHKWNNYPDVEPPLNVWMRVERGEGLELRRGVARYVVFSDENECVWMDRGIITDVDRFRPWDEEDEE